MGLLSKLLGTISGGGSLKVSEQLIFDKVIGFRGVVPGVGTSSIVQNVAISMSENHNLSVAVVDTSYLYPIQYPMLVTDAEGKRKDYLDYIGQLQDVATVTSHKNVTLFALSNRGVSDMLSSKDNEVVLNEFIKGLKTYFDIVLIDLSHEMTNINTYASVKCNKIFNIVDQSLKGVYHFQKSLNTMATLAVPLGKANRVVLNKVVPDIVTNTKGVISDARMKLIGEIPLSAEIAKRGVTGKKLYDNANDNSAVRVFSKVIDSIVEEILGESSQSGSLSGVDADVEPLEALPVQMDALQEVAVSVQNDGVEIEEYTVEDINEVVQSKEAVLK